MPSIRTENLEMAYQRTRFLASLPKPPSKSRRNAPHPTSRKRPRETRRPFAPDIPRLASPVVTNAVAGELTLCASRR